jgi:hypothetical protein
LADNKVWIVIKQTVYEVEAKFRDEAIEKVKKGNVNPISEDFTADERAGR